MSTKRDRRAGAETSVGVEDVSEENIGNVDNQKAVGDGAEDENAPCGFGVAVVDILADENDERDEGEFEDDHAAQAEALKDASGKEVDLSAAIEESDGSEDKVGEIDKDENGGFFFEDEFPAEH